MPHLLCLASASVPGVRASPALPVPLLSTQQVPRRGGARQKPEARGSHLCACPLSFIFCALPVAVTVGLAVSLLVRWMRIGAEGGGTPGVFSIGDEFLVGLCCSVHHVILISQLTKQRCYEGSSMGAISSMHLKRLTIDRLVSSTGHSARCVFCRRLNKSSMCSRVPC